MIIKSTHYCGGLSVVNNAANFVILKSTLTLKWIDDQNATLCIRCRRQWVVFGDFNFNRETPASVYDRKGHLLCQYRMGKPWPSVFNTPGIRMCFVFFGFVFVFLEKKHSVNIHGFTLSHHLLKVPSAS